MKIKFSYQRSVCGNVYAEGGRTETVDSEE